ncbi:MAG: hypothetical protein ACRD21_10940 [Vicinamibacteria bacterium]
MRLRSGSIWVDLAPEIVDEALFAAARSAEPSLRQEFLDDREAIGSIEIVDIREQGYRDLDARWAKRFRLSEPLIEALDDCGALSDGFSGCIIEKARVGTGEAAELRLDGDGGSRVLHITVKPETLLSRMRLRELVQKVL